MTETVSLRDLCKELKLDPREARVKLRATGKRAPKGKWEWPKAQVAAIKTILRGEPKKPAGHRSKPGAKPAKAKPKAPKPTVAKKPEVPVAASEAVSRTKPT